MGTAARETVAPPNNSQTQEGTDGVPKKEETQEQVSQQTQSTEQEASARMLALMETQMLEAHQRSQRLQAELDVLKDKKEEVAPVSVSATDFLNDPVSHITRIVKEQTEIAIKPLREFKDQLANESRYDKAKEKFRVDPRYKEIFPKIEGVLNSMMAGRDPTDEMMNAMILGAVGAYTTGQIPGIKYEAPAAQVTTTTEQPANKEQRGSEQVTMPAHLRSSGQPAQRNDGKPQVRELTENEDRLRRERGMTKEDFLGWIDLPPDQVVVSKIGKPPVNNESQVSKSNPNNAGGR